MQLNLFLYFLFVWILFQFFSEKNGVYFVLSAKHKIYGFNTITWILMILNFIKLSEIEKFR